MAKKRVTRSRKRQLEEPDKFIFFATKIVGIVAKYKTFLLSVAGAIILIIVAISSFYYYSDRAESKASVMLANSLAKYEKIKAEQEAVKAYREVSDDFMQIVENNWSKDRAKPAMVMFGNICYNAGEFDRATELYNKALSGFKNNPFIKDLIFNGIAYSREGKKDYNTAVEYFNKILSGPNDKIKDETLFNLGRLYAVMGDKEKSIEAFNKIISEHKDSSYLELAKEKMFHSF